MSIRTAIIGCGDIAGGYDEKKKDGGIFTHAGAYKSNPEIEIVAAYDINTKRLEKFSDYWSVKQTYESIEELLNDTYDIISVCTPDDTHKSIIEQILKSGKASYVWAEKPLTLTASSAEVIIKLANEKRVGVWLSYQRRWEPAHKMLKKKIQNGIIGDLIHVTVYYVKGIVHIGSTAIDTLRFLFGEISWVAAFPPFNTGSYGNDYSLRGILGFKRGGSATVIGCDTKKYIYSLFEMDVVGTKGRVKIENSGDKISYYDVGEYGHYSGFGELRLAEVVNTEMKLAMKYGLDILVDGLSRKRYSTFLAEEGMKNLEVVDAMKKSSEKGGIKIELN